jgi:hypothetical protein
MASIKLLRCCGTTKYIILLYPIAEQIWLNWFLVWHKLEGTKLHSNCQLRKELQRRHVLCVGVGVDRIHAARAGGAGHARLRQLGYDNWNTAP